MKTQYRIWVRFEDPCDYGKYQVCDRVHDYPLGIISYDSKQRRWILKPRKRLNSMEQKYRDDIADFLEQLNKKKMSK